MTDTADHLAAVYRQEARAKGEPLDLVLGLDPSTAATGIAHVDGTFSTVRPGVEVHDATDRARRIHELGAMFDLHLRGRASPDLAVVEGYSLGGARGYAAAYVAEAGGELRRRLFLHGARILEIAPSRLKKYATGDGGKRTTKKVMLAAALLDVRRTGPLKAGENSWPRNADEADAYWLRRLGLDLLTEPAEHDDVPADVVAARRKIRALYAGEVVRWGL